MVRLRQMTVTCKERARLGMNVNRARARRDTLPVECVVGKQNQFLRAGPNEFKAMPARRAASGQFAVSGEALHRRLHGGTHGFGNRRGHRNDLELLHGDLALVFLTRSSLHGWCLRNLSGMRAKIRGRFLAVGWLRFKWSGARSDGSGHFAAMGCSRLK